MKLRYGTRWIDLSDDEQNRLADIEQQILELQREKSKILKNRTLMFEEERDYLASFIPDFYLNGTSSRHRQVRMNPRYSALWTGIRQSAEYAVFHLNKVPKDATDEQILAVRREIVKQIDWLNQNVIQKGLLWI